MPKLILKQQASTHKISWFRQHASHLAYAGFVGLLLIISLGISLTFKPMIPSSSFPLPSLDSATDIKLKAKYLDDWEKLSVMQTNYEDLAKNTKTHDQALILLNQAEMAWQHLLIMSEAVDDLGLSAAEKKALEEQQAFLQDQWSARVHFSELRLDRFNTAETASSNPEQLTTAATPLPTEQVIEQDSAAISTPATELTASVPTNTKYIAQPPAGVELPAGFCTLDGSKECKPTN